MRIRALFTRGKTDQVNGNKWGGNNDEINSGKEVNREGRKEHETKERREIEKRSKADWW